MSTTTVDETSMAAAVDVQLPTLEHLDPFTLVLNTNVRTKVDLDPLFIDSIRERGVLVPVVAHRDRHGQVVVDQGQRRTLAATEAGLASIPVYVHPHEPETGARIVDQLTENAHRAGLHQSEVVDAVEQLALVGYTPSQIAKRVSIPKDVAAAAVKVAGSKVAREHADTMTLEDAAVLVEFQDDPDAVERLSREAGYGRGLASTAARIRQDYAERDLVDNEKAVLTANGLTVIDRPAWDDRKTLSLTQLRDQSAKKISPKRHAEKCPGHVVWVEIGWQGASRTVVTTEGCSGWKKHGHTDLGYSSSGGPKVAAADMTPDERAAAAAERKHVIESNKDWRAATTVRRQWLLDFAQRKTAPAGAEQLLADAVSTRWANDIDASTHELWKLIGTTHEDVAQELQHASRGRALHIALVLCLASWEATLADDAWRHTGSGFRVHHDRDALVLRTIGTWGHDLSAIEQRVIDDTAREVRA